jgi:cephalosporin hydroxylase
MTKAIKILYIVFIFYSIQPKQSLAVSDESWKQYKNQVLSYQDSIPGWCCREKAERMMDVVYETKPEICVEIGVFGGSSIYPTASALKFLRLWGQCMRLTLGAVLTV